MTALSVIKWLVSPNHAEKRGISVIPCIDNVKTRSINTCKPKWPFHYALLIVIVKSKSFVWSKLFHTSFLTKSGMDFERQLTT